MTQAVGREPVRHEPPSATAAVFFSILLLTIAGIAWVAIAVGDPMTLPIKKVLVEGEFTYLDPEVMQAAVIDAVDAGFFGVNVAEIRSHLLDEPWIRDATIRRVWPDALHVRVVEQVPVARWGEQAFLNEQGDIFAPELADTPPALVRLHGPLGAEIDVLKQYLEFSQQLASVGLVVDEVFVSPRFAWILKTRDGKQIVLGRKDLAVRMARFLFGYSHGLADAWTRISRVDMRYTNGFSVAQQQLEPEVTSMQPASSSMVEDEDRIDG